MLSFIEVKIVIESFRFCLYSKLLFLRTLIQQSTIDDIIVAPIITSITIKSQLKGTGWKLPFSWSNPVIPSLTNLL